jgi:hypothetical protein
MQVIILPIYKGNIGIFYYTLIFFASNNDKNASNKATLKVSRRKNEGNLKGEREEVEHL